MTFSQYDSIVRPRPVPDGVGGAITDWFRAKGRQYAPGYGRGKTPGRADGQYTEPPATLGDDIVAASQWYPGYPVDYIGMAGQICDETAGWQSAYARERNNPGGIGAINSNPDLAIRFVSPLHGCIAHAAHLLVYALGDGAWAADDPRWSAMPGAETWRRETLKLADWRLVGAAQTWNRLNGRWAYPGTDYGDGIETLGRQLETYLIGRGFDIERTQPMAVPRIALSAGHHNTSGGNALEYQQVGELTEAIAAACRTRGMDVRVITPDGPDADSDPGDGDFHGNLSAAAARVVEWSNAGWKADVFLEVHTEGAGGARGAFAIYPDTGNDVDIDVKTVLGPMIATRLRDATGMPIRGNGTMSERNTGVGAQGYRLGIFGATESVRDFCTRLIIEFGAHDNAADLAIFNKPDFNAKAAAVVADSFAVFLKFSGGTPEPGTVRPPEVSDPSARHFAETDRWIQWGFKGYYESYGDKALWIFGYPLTNEMTEDGRPVQYFERAVFEWHADKNLVLLRRLGAEALELRSRAA